MPSRIFLVNVGANASHGGVRSPLFEDGTFELLPIPEERDLWAPTLPAYAKMVCFNDPGETLAKYVPVRYWNVRVHDDPEFHALTYGDNPNRSPRAAGLRACGPGDYLTFLARLVPYAGGRFRGPPGFYLVGFFLVEEVLRDVARFPRGRDFTVYGGNAHIRRAAYHRAALDGFWVWKGSAEGSQRLRHAVPLGRALCVAALRDARGDPWRWARPEPFGGVHPEPFGFAQDRLRERAQDRPDEGGAGRSDLQTIGSYTRSARLVIDGATEEGAARAGAWWKAVAARNPDAPVPFPGRSSLRILGR